MIVLMLNGEKVEMMGLNLGGLELEFVGGLAGEEQEYVRVLIIVRICREVLGDLDFSRSEDLGRGLMELFGLQGRAYRVFDPSDIVSMLSLK